MATGHAGNHHHLHVPGSTPVHRLPPDAKVAGLVLFVIVVALTPRRAVWVFGIDAALLVALVVVARIPVRVLVARLAAVVPFVAFAVFIPFVAGGEQVDVLGVSLSTEGLWSTWNIVVKALIGTTASIVLSATTPVPDIVHGLSRLRFPAVMVSTIAFMFRYLDVVADQLTRMRRSMTARCHDPRWLWQAGPIASSAGALFVRSYERGERVHHAMLARGFTGRLPILDDRRATRIDWLVAVAPAVVAALALTTHLLVPR